MYAQKKLRFGIAFILVLFGITAVSSNAFAGVKRVSLEKTRWDGQNRYLDVTLTCSGDDQPRLIRRPAKSSAKWCAVSVGSLCHRSKYTLARAVCKYDAEKFASLRNRNKTSGVALSDQKQETQDAAVAAVEKEDSSSSNEQKRTELLREQMLIEEQRIDIEQRRLRLIAEEIELKKTLNTLAAAGG